MERMIGIALCSECVEGLSFLKDTEYEVIVFEQKREIRTVFFDNKGKPKNFPSCWYYRYVVKMDGVQYDFTLDHELFNIKHIKTK